MRMVSNKHVSTASMKRFKRVHVQHKMYVDGNNIIKTPVKIDEKVEETPKIEEVNKTEVIENVLATEAKPKRTRKRAEETIENNEENPEDNG